MQIKASLRLRQCQKPLHKQPFQDTCVPFWALAAQNTAKAPRTNSYAVNVTAAEGAAFKTLGRLPLYSPRNPSLLYICAKHAGRDLTESAPTLAPYCTARSRPAICAQCNISLPLYA